MSHRDYNLQHDLMFFACWSHPFLANVSKNTQGSFAHVTLLSSQSTSQQSLACSLTSYRSQQSCNFVATRRIAIFHQDDNKCVNQISKIPIYRKNDIHTFDTVLDYSCVACAQSNASCCQVWNLVACITAFLWNTSFCTTFGRWTNCYLIKWNDLDNYQI